MKLISVLSLAILCLAGMSFFSAAFAWEAKVFQVQGKKVTIATTRSAGVRQGTRLYVVENGKEVGYGRVSDVFHTKVELQLLGGKAQKDMVVTDLRPSAAGAKIAVAKSVDLTKWKKRMLPRADNWNTLAYGNGLFVALPRYRNSTEALVSKDGIRWELRKMPFVVSNFQITYGNGLFLAVGSQTEYAKDRPNFVEAVHGIAMTSADAVEWKVAKVPAFANTSPDELSYGNGLFLVKTRGFAGNGEGVGILGSSIDGHTWVTTARAEEYAGAAIIGGNGVFLYVDRITQSIGVSADGGKWDFRKHQTEDWFNVGFGNGTFLALEKYGNKAFLSQDGVSWIEHASAIGPSWDYLSFFEDKFIIVKGDEIGYSTNGLEWTRHKFPPNMQGDIIGSAVSCGNNRCVILIKDKDYLFTTP